MDIIFDIDGTLADASHRLPHITNPDEPANWDAFFDGSVDDTPIPEAWAILTALLHDRNRVIFATGRPERIREKTINWLTDAKCPHRSFASLFWTQTRLAPPPLYMRHNDWRMPSSEVKSRLLKDIRADGFDPKVAFEDRVDDVATWRAEGLFCCQVDEGNF